MNTKEKTRIVILGLDACDVDLMLRWTAEGRMPFLASLLKRSAFGRLISTKGMFSDSPWPSLNAGVSPAKHAFYNHLQIKRGTVEVERVDVEHLRYPPFWSQLRGSGKRVVVFDVPKTFPIAGVDGAQICGWSEHYPLLKTPASAPPSLVDEINRHYGKYRHPEEVTVPKTVAQERRLYRKMCSNVDLKCRATEELMQREPWDLFFSVFSEVHYGGHQFYHHFEKTHWANRPDSPPDFAEMLPDLHTRLDASVAGLFKHISDETTFFIVSVHGFATNFSANHLMPKVMELLGFSAPPAGVRPINTVGKLLQWSQSLRGLIPASGRAFINKHIVSQETHDRAHSNIYSNHVDWTKTRAFFLPVASDHCQGYISVNLKGREPMGIVSPGAEFENVCDELCRKLNQLINPRTNKPAVRNVARIRDMYQGPNLLELPDVVIQWACDEPIDQLSHPSFDAITDRSFALRRTQHAPDGFLIAGGPHINIHADIREASTLDFAPTILYLLGQPIPSDMDGRILLDLIDDEFKRGHEPSYRSSLTPEQMALGVSETIRNQP